MLEYSLRRILQWSFGMAGHSAYDPCMSAHAGELQWEQERYGEPRDLQPFAMAASTGAAPMDGALLTGAIEGGGPQSKGGPSQGHRGPLSAGFPQRPQHPPGAPFQAATVGAAPVDGTVELNVRPGLSVHLVACGCYSLLQLYVIPALYAHSLLASAGAALCSFVFQHLAWFWCMWHA